MWRRCGGMGGPNSLSDRNPAKTHVFTNSCSEPIKVGGEHLRLFAEHNAQGVQASVYNVNAKSWIAPSEAVEDIEQGKEKAAEYAKANLRKATGRELPRLTWKKSRSR